MSPPGSTSRVARAWIGDANSVAARTNASKQKTAALAWRTFKYRTAIMAAAVARIATTGPRETVATITPSAITSPAHSNHVR